MPNPPLDWCLELDNQSGSALTADYILERFTKALFKEHHLFEKDEIVKLFLDYYVQPQDKPYGEHGRRGDSQAHEPTTAEVPLLQHTTTVSGELLKTQLAQYVTQSTSRKGKSQDKNTSALL